MKKSKPNSNPIPIKNTPPKKASAFYFLAGVLIINFVVFQNSFKNKFVYDDIDYIINNPFLQSLSLSNIWSIFTSYYSANYHPLTTLSWAIEYNLYNVNPLGYHIVNLILHSFNIILVYLLVKRLCKNEKIALFSSIIFAVHPMHVESVAWISERKDLLYSFFYLLGIVFYLNYTESKKKLTFFHVSAFFILSCLSKSAAITFPLVLLIIDYYQDNITVKTVLQKIPFFVISVIFGLIAIQSQKTINAINTDVLQFPFFYRVLFIFYSVFYYLRSFFLPINLSAMHFYPKIGDSLSLEYYVAPLILFLIPTLAFLFKKYRKDILFGFLFYLITISLVIQLIPLGKSIVSERYSYIPYIGISITIASLILKFENKLGNYLLTSISIICLLFYSAYSYKRVTVWKNGVTLFSDVIKKYPNESFGYRFRQSAKIMENDYEGSISDGDMGLKLDSMSLPIMSNRGYAKFVLLDYKGALADFNAIIKKDSSCGDIYLKRGKSKNELKDYNGAIKDFYKAIALDSTLSSAYLDISNAKIALNLSNDALKDLDILMQKEPNNAAVYYNKGNCYFQLQKFKDAIEFYTTAIKLNPNHDAALCNRGVAYLNLNNTSAACLDFKQSMSMGNTLAAEYFKRCK